MTLLYLLPESCWILIIVGLGFGIMFRLIKPAAAFGIIGSLVIVHIAGLFLEPLFDMLPTWLFAIIILLVAIKLLSWVINAIFGRGTASHFWGQMLHDIALFPFRVFARRR